MDLNNWYEVHSMVCFAKTTALEVLMVCLWFSWHFKHPLTTFSISASIPGHERYILARLVIRLIPGCPWCNSSNNWFLPGGGTKTFEIHPFKVDNSDFHLTNCCNSSGHWFGQPFWMYLYTRDKIGLEFWWHEYFFWVLERFLFCYWPLPWCLLPEQPI